MQKYQLIVVGGGFAGTAAAICGARQGLSTLLIEKSNALGGAANNSLVNPFMPYRAKVNGEMKDLSAGLFKEITDELEKMGGFYHKKTAKETYVFNEECLKLILNRLLVQSGAKVLFHTYLTDAKTENGIIKSITVANKSGITEFFGDVFVDGTGDADLAHLSGCTYKVGREEDGLCQAMTLPFRMGNVDMELYKKESPDITPLYNEWQKQGKIKNPMGEVLILPNVAKNVLHFNSTRAIKYNPLDAWDLTRAELETREQVFELYDFLRQNFKAFENAEILFTAPSIGVRESRRIDGEYLLTHDDLVKCTMFHDAVALGNYDTDIHDPSGGNIFRYHFKEGEYYSIPYRCLVPKAVSNLLVAGRCISATHEAQGSIRIMPTACCLGQAAGTAAAIAVEDHVSMKLVDTQKLRQILAQNNAAI